MNSRAEPIPTLTMFDFDDLMTKIMNEPSTLHQPDPETVRRLIRRRSYGMLSTVSPAGHPHAAGVLYVMHDDHLYITTRAGSRKARNVAASGRAAMVVPIRRVPAGGPPSAVQFQADAAVRPPGDDQIRALLDQGVLRSITSHGELDLPDSCFIEVVLPHRLHTYGIGMSLVSLIRHPLDAGGIVDDGRVARPGIPKT